MDVSVIISTCNRVDDVRRLLSSLADIEMEPGYKWELILVDNRSTDATAQVIRDYSESSRFPLKYVFEQRQGKSFGLNSGLAVASGRILAFTDDDVFVPSDWIMQLIRFFDGTPDAACVGGMVKLHNPQDAHVSVRLSPEPAVFGIQEFAVTSIQVIGCNMAMRAGLFREIGDFDINLGPGSRIGVAEDIDILYRVLAAGHSIHYAPQIWVSHNHGRRTKEQLEKVTYGYLTGRGAFYCKHLLERDWQVARWAYWECRSLAKSLFGVKGRQALRSLRLIALGSVRYLLYRQHKPSGLPAPIVA